MFLDAIEVNVQEAKMKLKMLKSFLEHAKNGSNLKLIKAAKKSFERRKIQLINSKSAARTARLHVKAAKAGNVVFDKIVRNYISCNGTCYAKYENNSNVEIAKTLSTKDIFFIFSIRAEKLDSFYCERVIRFLKDKLKDSKSEIESLQSYIKKVESGTRSNIEMIDVLKARLKVPEIQLDAYKLCEEEAG